MENDIDVNEIFSMAQRYGFSGLTMKLLSNQSISLNKYNLITEKKILSQLKDAPKSLELLHKTYKACRQLMTDKGIFFLHKGVLELDSRNFEGTCSRHFILKTNLFGICQ